MTSPLRVSILTVVTALGAVCPATASALAGVAEHRALAYLVHLDHIKVMRQRSIVFTPGQEWKWFEAYHNASRPRIAIANVVRSDRRQVGEMIKELRKQSGRSIRSLALVAGITHVTWWQVEHGHITVRPETQASMIAACQVAT